MPVCESEHRSPLFLMAVAREAIEITCEACNVTPFEMKSKRRSRAHIAYARQIAMYLAHVVGQLSLSEVSHAFDRDRTTVAHACQTIEDRRDGPIFERQIDYLESELRARLALVFSRLRVRAAPSLADIRAVRASLR